VDVIERRSIILLRMSMRMSVLTMMFFAISINSVAVAVADVVFIVETMIGTIILMAMMMLGEFMGTERIVLISTAAARTN